MQEDQDPIETEMAGQDPITDENQKARPPARDESKPRRGRPKGSAKRKFDIHAKEFVFVPPMPRKEFEALKPKTQEEMVLGQRRLWEKARGRAKN